MVEVEHRQTRRLRPGGDDDLVGLDGDGASGALGARGLAPTTLPGPASRPVPRTHLTPAFFSRTSTFSRSRVTMPSLRAIMRAKSGLISPATSNPYSSPGARPGQRVGAGQQRLGRDAAPVEAGAADEVVLHQGDGGAVARGPQARRRTRPGRRR